MGAKSLIAGDSKLAHVARTLVMATALGSVLVATTAEAQTRRERERQQQTRAPQAEYSEAFVAAYNAARAPTLDGATDFSAARPLIPAMLAATVSNDEKEAAGNLLLQVGQNLRDVTVQRQGIELMLASGKVPPESQGRYYYYVGNFALQANDRPAAIEALRQAIARNFVPAEAAQTPALDPRSQLLQVLLQARDNAGVISTVDQWVVGATGAVPELWLNYGLQAAIGSEDPAAAGRFSVPLVTSYPTARNVRNAVRVALQQAQVRNGPIMADGMRLLYVANAMTAEEDITNYVTSIEPRLMATETQRVLRRGHETGVLPETDDFYVRQMEVANTRAPGETRDAPQYLRDAQSAPTGQEAYEAAELFFSLGDWAQAEQMYALALTKGSTDQGRDLMRQGIAQAMQGKKAEASATFAAVQGDRAALAALWSAWLASQG